MAAMLVCRYILGASAVQLAGEDVGNSSGTTRENNICEVGESAAQQGHANVEIVHPNLAILNFPNLSVNT